MLAAFDDPFLPRDRIDLVLLVDSCHHLQDRVACFSALRRTLAHAGRIAVVEWKSGSLGMGPPPELKVPDGVRPEELTQAGYALVERFEFHGLHVFEIWHPSS